MPPERKKQAIVNLVSHILIELVVSVVDVVGGLDTTTSDFMS